MHETNTEAANKIREIVEKNDDVVAFIGAGLSKFPKWNAIIKKMSEEFHLPITRDREEDDEWNYKVAKTVKDMGKADYDAFLKREYGLFPTTSSESLNYLVEIDLHGFVTTNFDQHLILAARRIRKQQHYFDHSDWSMKKMATHVGYMHGTAFSPDVSVVFGKDEYDDAYGNRPRNLKEFLNSLFYDYTVLFVGYQLSERLITDIMKHLFEYRLSISVMLGREADPPKKHYALIARPYKTDSSGSIEKTVRDFEKQGSTEERGSGS